MSGRTDRRPWRPALRPDRARAGRGRRGYSARVVIRREYLLRGVVQGKKAQISGYHDAQGDLAANQELAKQRAFAVRDALMFFGATEEAIVLKKPEQTLASGDDAHARRVEVTLLP